MRFRSFAGTALSLAVALLTSFHAVPAAAQAGYPARPVTLVVPQAAGGTNDIVGRLVGQKLGEVMAASVVVDNRPGAGGNIGTQLVAKAPKDGYSLLMTISSSQAINPALYKNPGFDPVKDFRPVGLIGAVPNVLLVNPTFPAKSMAEFLALAKRKDANLQYASAGNGTLNHLLGEMLNNMAGIQLQHVPYKGVAPAINDVIGGQLPILFASLPSALQHIKSGKLRALAVSGEKRSPSLPDVPAIAEVLPGYEYSSWYGLFGPARMPKDMVDKLAGAARAALGSPEMAKRLVDEGLVPVGSTPAEFQKFVAAEIVRWGKVVAATGAKPE